MNRHDRRVEAAEAWRKYIPARYLRERYRVSDMTIWRWLRDENLGFPKPTLINRRRYWILADLEDWEAMRAASALAKRGKQQVFKWGLI
jgi:predicted DNA-binding transcriptional regulator AlpA